MTATTPRKTRLARLSRRLGLDRNPLRRPTDRVETWILAGLLAAFLIGAPVAATAAAAAEHAAGVRALRAQQAWRHVPAVLMQSAGSDGSSMYESFGWVRAKWIAPGRKAQIGRIPVMLGKRAGSTVHIWVDRAGHAMAAPLTRSQITRGMVGAAVFAPFGLAVLLLAMAGLTHRLFSRRRLAGWATAWAAVEPQWSRRT